MKLVTVSCGNFEACPNSQGAEAFRIVLVQLKSRRQSQVSNPRIALIDPEEIRTVALIVEQKTPFRRLISPALGKPKVLW